MTFSDRGNRVVASHVIASSALRLAGAFGVVAVVWALVVATRGGSWWGPTHAFLVGTVLLAISGTSQMFTITWSTSAAPPALVATLQRWSIVVGAAAVLVGLPPRNRTLIVGGGVVLLVGIGLLAWSLLRAIRRSLLRRFDLSSRFYFLALASGTVGIVLGVLIGWGVGGPDLLTMRAVHGHLNLVGLVGFTIVGTIPTLMPTFAHHRAVSGIEAKIGLWVAVAAALTILSGLAFGPVAIGVGTVAAGLSVCLVAGGVVVRLGRRGLKGGLSYFQVGLGSAWLVAWSVVDGLRYLIGEQPPAFQAVLRAAVIVGVGQVLAGALAYITPVLAGPAPRLGRNLDRMLSRPALPLVLANVGGLGLALGIPGLSALLFIWAAEFGWRLVGLERGGSRATG